MKHARYIAALHFIVKDITHDIYGTSTAT